MAENALTVIEAEPAVESAGTGYEMEISSASADRIISTASDIATKLKRIIDRQHLYDMIGDKKHVRVEGWIALARLNGFIPREVSCEPTDPDLRNRFVSRVELVRLSDGLALPAASAECGSNERRWSKADSYAIRSMATTRATGKASRMAFSWIMALAGYETTPYEEMDRSMTSSTPVAQTPQIYATPAGGLKRADASKIVGAASSRSKALGLEGIEIHGFRIINHVLKDLGLETAPANAKSPQMHEHLCRVVDSGRLDNIIRGVERYAPADSDAEPTEYQSEDPREDAPEVPF